MEEVSERRGAGRFRGLPAGPGWMVVVFIVSGLGFSWPWLSAGDVPVGLDAYSPYRDGGSQLVEVSDSGGETVRYESRNLELVPNLRAMNDLRPSQTSGVQEPYLLPGEDSLPPEALESRLAGVEVYRQWSRVLDADGEVSTSESILVRDERGERLVDVSSGGREVAFSPSVLLLPPDFGPDSGEWSSEGSAGNGTYESSGRVVESGRYEGASGSFDDCLLVEVSISIRQDGETVSDSTYRERYCRGFGLVETREIGPGGDTVVREVVLSSDGPSSGGNLPVSEPAPDGGEGLPSPDGSWSLLRVATVVPEGEASSEGTFSPVVSSGTHSGREPVILVAGLGGDLLSLKTGSPGGEPAWTYHTGGSVYGRPTFDASGGRVYFGATDAMMYALDARGLYLWSFEAGDSVASSPLVTEERVIFGSEDRNVYGLDADTGKETWRYGTGGPVASSAALVGGVAVIGSDDGAVYGLDPATGGRVWFRNIGGPVEAPVVADGDTVYVASRDGKVYALDGKTGRLLWDADAISPVEAAPATGHGMVYAVDDGGELTAFDIGSGRRLWGTSGNRFAGSPVVTEGGVLVAGKDGGIYSFDPSGRRNGSWDRTNAEDGEAATRAFQFGPTAGGGAVWVVDTGGRVMRLGPEDDGG